VESKPFEGAETGAEDFVQFWAAGDSGKGDYRCSACSYGVTVHRKLPVCPMCAGRSWEQAAWSPFSRAGQLP
jgi:rubrerythrin